MLIYLEALRTMTGYTESVQEMLATITASVVFINYRIVGRIKKNSNN